MSPPGRTRRKATSKPQRRQMDGDGRVARWEPLKTGPHAPHSHPRVGRLWARARRGGGREKPGWRRRARECIFGRGQDLGWSLAFYGEEAAWEGPAGQAFLLCHFSPGCARAEGGLIPAAPGAPAAPRPRDCAPARPGASPQRRGMSHYFSVTEHTCVNLSSAPPANPRQPHGSGRGARAAGIRNGRPWDSHLRFPLGISGP